MRGNRVAFFFVVLAGLLFGRSALAHPMGNFSVNHYAKIELRSDRIVIRYIIDLAEIPTFQELQQGNISATAGDTAVLRYVGSRGAELGRGLSILIGGKRLPLRILSSDVIFPPGAGGLPTMKMGFTFEALLPVELDRSHINLRYVDGNYEGHAGWKEIIAIATAGKFVASSVPTSDRSAALSNYPTDLLNSPPQNLDASIEASLPPLALANSLARAPVAEIQRPHAKLQLETPTERAHSHSVETIGNGSTRIRPALATVYAPNRQLSASAPIELKANRQATPRSKFTELISAQHLSLWFLLTACVIAVGLGAFHALEPGHGKTIVAAYLVGSRGTARHAALLGLIVTASHTAGVFALGAITIFASRYIVPEQLYPWLGALSGITIAALGLYMFLRRATGASVDHSHGAGQSHAHWSFSKRPTVETADAEAQCEDVTRKSVSLGQLLALGTAGGIIPCPAALVVLLSAFALHRIAVGMLLIVAFSSGLAAVLVAFGMLMVYAGRFMSRFKVDGPLTRRWLPAASSAFVAILGIALAGQAFASMHLRFLDISRERVGSFLFVVGLGLVLGMRHSTDPDHVVAISTIVSRQRGMRNAAMIGSVWGLGHTLTVFAVGALIILFGVEIPPRIGLSMEFCVAVMLVLLGVLNLTGVLKKITARLTPAAPALSRLSQENSVGLGAEPDGSHLANPISGLGVYQLVRPLVIGLVHGLAGSAAVALLVLSTIHDPAWATAYLLVFGFGTMIGMMLMTTAISGSLVVAGNRSAWLGRYFGVASGVVSMCFGAFLVYQLGFIDGLFTAHPMWTPQ